MLEVIYDDLNNEQLSKDPDEVKCTQVCMERTIIVCQLIGSNDLERRRGTNGG